MVLGKIIEGLKKLGSSTKEEVKKGFPARYFAVTWNRGARRFGVGGSRNKVIRRVEGQENRDYWPYNKHIANALEKVMNEPMWDETGGESDPSNDMLAYFDPGQIAYDQSRLRRK